MCALLFALLDYTKKYRNDTACTSQPCECNKGRSSNKNPKRVKEAAYHGTYKKRKLHNLNEFDPRPPNLRGGISCEERNSFIRNLKGDTSSPGNSMWLTILPVMYDDYKLNDEEMRLLKAKCHLLVSNLSVNDGNGECPIEVCSEQGSEQWDSQRRLRVTASDCKKVLSLSKQSSIYHF